MEIKTELERIRARLRSQSGRTLPDFVDILVAFGLLMILAYAAYRQFPVYSLTSTPAPVASAAATPAPSL
jgi:hypothetical protein